MMENLHITGTENTPGVDFDFNIGILEMSGKSYSADPTSFYKPVLDWVESYVLMFSSRPTVFNVRLEQFDDESTKILLYVFQKLGKLPQLKVNWFYNDVHILEIGEDLSYMGGTHFDFVKTG